MQFKRVLVTGGGGFIGHRLVENLAARSIHAGVLDNLFVKMPMPKASAFVAPYEADIRDVAAVERIISEFGPDAIVHLAAIHHIPTCERDPRTAMEVNVVGTQVILDAAEKHGVRNVIIASSAAVYDWWDSALIEDETPLKATDVYSTGKLANEFQLRTWASRCGGKGFIARIFNVIGHDDPNGHLIPDILSQLNIKDGRVGTPRIGVGNTDPRRDYTHANDTSRGLEAMLDHMDWGGQIEAFNLSRGEEHSVVDLLKIIGRHFDCELSMEHDPARVRRVDRLHLLGDSRKSHSVLGWQAQYGIDESVQDIVRHLVDHQQA